MRFSWAIFQKEKCMCRNNMDKPKPLSLLIWREHIMLERFLYLPLNLIFMSFCHWWTVPKCLVKKDCLLSHWKYKNNRQCKPWIIPQTSGGPDWIWHWVKHLCKHELSPFPRQIQCYLQVKDDSQGTAMSERVHNPGGKARTGFKNTVQDEFKPLDINWRGSLWSCPEV